MCWRNPDLFADLVYGVEAMRGGAERLMGSREAVERFVRLLEENRGRHVLVTADGVSFIGDAGDEIASIVEEQELREFFYSHTPHRDVGHFVFSHENPGWLVVGLGL